MSFSIIKQIIYDDDFDRADIFATSSIAAVKFGELKEESKAFSNANIDESLTLTKGLTDLGLVLYTSGMNVINIDFG